MDELQMSNVQIGDIRNDVNGLCCVTSDQNSGQPVKDVTRFI